ncbi:hypothetical protein D1224_10780 [Henriciella barbarensis]|uniref:DUF2946 domain-containing protein n=1 Tax=Henriciella barbarensis TaxID=86342 RepID=A0A399QPJ7_9PROT|nr:hypothetical protein [Henriciella barbarensis]RIJ20791.1 hypothetical protein D1224_14330 [Henriciella barbarensis]RIJ20816.1 hypothetical protein D1224_14160 [Henriciella barbarensis]RIJ22486.1 hypothetical protein D1224_10865 [Henriciella barbarensis]RIJ24679.1 hypothetical protein D1224_10780 [Henriciella barbarensis]
MPILIRLLTLLAAAILTAQPVMACPFMLGDEAATKVEISTSHPCHDMAMEIEADADKSPQSSSDSDCLAGTDCAPMLIQAQSDANPITLSADPSPVLPIILAEAPVAFPPERSTLSTGPPPNAVLPHQTPISLKQRFLN